MSMYLSESNKLFTFQVDEDFMRPSSAWATAGVRDITMYVVDPPQGKERHADIAGGEKWDEPGKLWNEAQVLRLLLTLLLRHDKAKMLPFSICLYEGGAATYRRRGKP